MAKAQVRYDIEGLRGFAIALVVIFHVWIGRVSSGVDVFLLIGGIFFFGSQLRNARSPRGLTLPQSLLRMLRRLYPLLVVVVTSTLVACLALMSRLVHVQMAQDAAASLGYFVNWQLAYSGRDYNSVSLSISPFQHLWSMSAQMQIYAASLVAVGLIAFIFRRHSHGALIAILSAATILSFLYATWLHGEDQSLNYYSTASRFWEVGLGGLIGLLLLRKDSQGNPVIRMRDSRLRFVLGIVGISMIACTGLVLDGARQFPGPLTLVPLVGAAMVILSGQSGQPVGVTRFLESRPMQELGSISYALYLWHWPLLVLALNYTGEVQVSFALGAAVIGASLVLAWLSKKIIEDPLRQKRKPRRAWFLVSPRYWATAVRPMRAWPKAVAAVLIVVSAGSVAMAPAWIQSRIAMNNEELWAAVSDRAVYPGANSFLYNTPSPEGIPLGPPLEDLDDLLPVTQSDGCQIGFEPDYLILTKEYNRSDEPCEYGDISSERTLYLIGGSHSEHYLPALEIIGKRQGIKIIPLLKMGCPVNSTVTRVDGSEYPSCLSWSARVMQFIRDVPPTEGIFMVGTRPTSIIGVGPEQVPAEYVDTVRQFTEWGIPSYLIRDNPWHTAVDAEGKDFWFDVRKCVVSMMEGTWKGSPEAEDFPGVADESAPTFEEILKINGVCGTPIGDSLLPVDPSLEAYAGLNVKHLDITAAICQNGWCPPIIGNIFAYRDMHHFTNAFVETLSDEIEAQMFDPLHPLPSLDAAFGVKRGVKSTAPESLDTPVVTLPPSSDPSANTPLVFPSQGAGVPLPEPPSSSESSPVPGAPATQDAPNVAPLPRSDEDGASDVVDGSAPDAMQQEADRNKSKLSVTTSLKDLNDNYWSYIQNVVPEADAS